MGITVFHLKDVPERAREYHTLGQLLQTLLSHGKHSTLDFEEVANRNSVEKVKTSDKDRVLCSNKVRAIVNDYVTWLVVVNEVLSFFRQVDHSSDCINNSAWLRAGCNLLVPGAIAISVCGKDFPLIFILLIRAHLSRKSESPLLEIFELTLEKLFLHVREVNAFVVHMMLGTVALLRVGAVLTRPLPAPVNEPV